MALVAAFTIRLSVASLHACAVDWATAADTATSPGDFTAMSGTLGFAPGETVQVVYIPVLANPALPVNKKFRLQLSNPVFCTLPAMSSNWCVISTTTADNTGDPPDNPNDPDVPIDPDDPLTPTEGQALRVLPTTVDFGTDHVPGVTVTRLLTLVNEGTVPLQVLSLSTAAPFAAVLPGPVTIPVSATMPVNIAFTQGTTVGEETGILTIVSGAPAPVLVPLIANSIGGTDAYVLTVAATLAFGAVSVFGSPKILPLLLVNTGTQPLSITAVTLTGARFARTVALPLTIAAGASVSIDVTYTPLSTTTPETGSIVITSQAPTKTVALTGTGTTALSGEPGPLIKDGLVTNAYHSELGRGGYFSTISGTSEGQAIFINAAFRSFEALDGGTTVEQAAADWYRGMAKTCLDAMGDGSLDGAMLRQPVPDDPNTITLLHWLFAARGDDQLQGINYDFSTAKASGNKLIIPATVPAGAGGEPHKGAADVFKVFMIYPSTSYILFYSPFSPTYASVDPTGDTSVRIADTDWARVGSTIEVTIPAGAPSGVTTWYVVYAYQNAGVLSQGDGYEAYPVWSAIPDGYSACAPDTFRWFDLAMNMAIAHDERAGNAVKWTKLRNALRRTAVRGQHLSDLREVFQPLPGFDAIPISGEPSGMFCYSDHPSATPPSPAQQAAGANPAWIGYNFWSRDTAGNIIGTVPTGPASAQVQLGRGFNDSWRDTTVYQENDNYFYVQLALDRVPGPAEKVYIYCSTTKYYDGLTRYYCDISHIVRSPSGTVEETLQTAAVQNPSSFAAGHLTEFVLNRVDFLRKDSDSAVLPIGTRFENFGISVEMAGPYKVRLGMMRIVHAEGKRTTGAQMPFFPGSMPFAINADTLKQRFIGFNGNPFHGYQLVDYWIDLNGDAIAVHGALASDDLPVPNGTTGVVEYPIALTNPNTTTKPLNALLMEQQLLFLKQASDKWVADGGARGPWAHTFVLNTPARLTIGNPDPGTWVYTNDDPNTRWLGYQCRVVESLALAAFRTGSASDFQAINTLCKTMAWDWLVWLNTAWPNLTGISVTDPIDGPITVRGMPTDFGDPGLGVPATLYEEVHGPALVLRAALWMKMVNAGTYGTVCDALMQRCWDYLEMFWVSAEDEMQYTWSPKPAAKQWYGFWHGEILTTLADMIAHQASLPAGIPVATLRLRLVQTQGWLAGPGVT